MTIVLSLRHGRDRSQMLRDEERESVALGTAGHARRTDGG